MKEREKQIIVNQFEKQQIEEEKKAREKQLKSIRMLEDVATANMISIAIKEKKRLEEKEQDHLRFLYNQKKQQEEMDRQMIEKKYKDHKEYELTKIREKAEQITDRNVEIEAARQINEFQKAEKESQLRDKLTEQKKLIILQQLEAGREKQFKEKEVRMTEKARAERDDFLQIIQNQKTGEEKERMIEEQKRQTQINHKILLKD